MSKEESIKIILPEGMDEFEADALLYKALSHHATGDNHTTESFEDPAMLDASQRMIDIHDKIYGEMIQEVIQVLEEEYE